MGRKGRNLHAKCYWQIPYRYRRELLWRRVGIGSWVPVKHMPPDPALEAAVLLGWEGDYAD